MWVRVENIEKMWKMCRNIEEFYVFSRFQGNFRASSGLCSDVFLYVQHIPHAESGGVYGNIVMCIGK